MQVVKHKETGKVVFIPDLVEVRRSDLINYIVSLGIRCFELEDELEQLKNRQVTYPTGGTPGEVMD